MRLRMDSFLHSYKSNPIKLNYIVPLDFNCVPNIPESHEWTEFIEAEQPFVDPLTFGSVPLINLAEPNAKSLIREACEKWSMFQVINHGVPVDLLTEVELHTRQLFSLPTHQKLRTLRASDGITGYGLPRISRFFPKLMWSEGFTLNGSPLEHATQLWPYRPSQQANFCDIMEKYQKEMKTMIERMVELMLASWELTIEDVDWFKPNLDCYRPQTVLQLNSYPVCPDPGRVKGLAPHTDSSLITVIHQSSTIGLHVLRNGIGWVPVLPIPGALIVNIGDLMQILFNGRFKSCLHQAAVSKTHRYSAAYFYGPPSEVKISPLTSLIDYDHPPLYRSVTWKEYLEVKAKHFNKALDVISNGIKAAT